MVGLAVRREVAAAHVFAVGADRARNHFADIGVFAREFRSLVEGEAKHIVHYQDLAVAVRAGTDPDGGDAQLAGDLRGEFAGHGFENDGEGACGFHGAGVAQQLLGAIGGLALHAVAAQRVDGLRREADVAHHGNFGFGEARDQFQTALAAFDFYGFDAGFFHEAYGVAQRFRSIRVIAAKGHVRDQERALRAAADGAGVMDHFVEGYRQRAVVTEGDHGERITDEDDVDACLVEQARGRIVVRRQADDFFGISRVGIFRGSCSRCLALQKLGHGDFAVALIWDDTHGGLRYRSLDSGYSPVPNFPRISNFLFG